MTPENQQNHYLHKYAVLKDYFDFYLSHLVQGQGKNAFFDRKIKNYLHHIFHQLSRFPYRASKKYLTEWKDYYEKLAEKVGIEHYPYKSVKFYFTWPFPLYYYGRLIKDKITGGETGISYEDWTSSYSS